MSTIRVAKNANYSVINNTVLNDPKLSWRAKGIAAYLLSKPDDWSINSQHLWKIGTEGRDAVRAAMNELEAAGYLHRRKVQDKTGKWSTESVFTETPTPENQASVFQASENQSSVFQAPILSTEVPSTELLSTDHSSDQGEGSKIVASPAPNGKPKLASDSYDLPPRQSEPPPPTVAKSPPPPRVSSPHFDPRNLRGGYIPAGEGANPIEIYFERFSPSEHKLNAPAQDDLMKVVTDMGRWRQAVTAWQQSGHKPGNIKGMLDWYHDPSKIPGSSRKEQSPNGHYPTTPAPAEPAGGRYAKLKAGKAT